MSVSKAVYLVLVLGVAGLANSPLAGAYPAYLKEFHSTYPAARRIVSCTLCHEQHYELNAFAQDFQDASYDFRAIEELDSNHDGVINRVEIERDQFPGRAVGSVTR